ncbi:MAG: alpha/beta hydrolase [Phycisphaerae bacterium]|nr:2-hydroxy-6-oxononadienedioate/2-hydroxy-6-oxononatrienedioate hydrolase [Phycisphaerales bacterium]MCK6475389.1 alpha/beta hydrolase [Phycisphaerales bacterium]
MTAREGTAVDTLGPVDKVIPLTGLSGRTIPARLNRAGQGRRAVLLHGMLAQNVHWQPLLERIAHRWHCTMLELPLLDLRDEDCSVDGVTHLTHQFIDQHAPEPAVYLGSSFGGHVALRIALENPRRVSGLILAGAAGVGEKPIAGDMTMKPTREWIRERVGAMFYDRGKHIREEDVDRVYAELSDRERARAIIRLTRSSRREYMGDRLCEIKVPALIAWGRQDAITPPEAAHEFASRLPDARLVWFDECSHAPMFEHPAQFADAMLAFADELDRREGRV